MKNLQNNVLIMMVVISLLSSGCAGNNWNENEKAIIGSAGGAAAGVLIASTLDASTAGVLGGAILGGLIGGTIGNRMDAADRREANRATYRALESAPSGNKPGKIRTPTTRAVSHHSVPIWHKTGNIVGSMSKP